MRRLRQDLSALFGSIAHPAAATFMSWGCAALTCHAYPLVVKGGYVGPVGAAFILCLPALFLASMLVAGQLALRASAQRSYLPGSRRLGHRTKLLASALLVPAVALPVATLAGSAAWQSWVPTSLMLFIALAAVLFPPAPPRWYQAIRPPWIARAAGRETWSSSQGPRAAVQIIRTCLGGMFLQRSVQRRLIGGVLAVFFAAAAIAPPWLGASGWRWTVIIFGLVAAGVVSTGFLLQLSRLTRGQIAELALIPGLGAPGAQRRALYRAVLAPPLPWLGVVVLSGSANLLLLGGEPLASIGMLAICALIMWLTYAILALQMLATLPPQRQNFVSQFLLLYVVVYGAGNYYWVYAAHPQLRLWLWFWLTPVLLSVGIGSAIGFSIRRLATAPHPFLARASVQR